jgi:hypothetical protein
MQRLPSNKASHRVLPLSSAISPGPAGEPDKPVIEPKQTADFTPEPGRLAAAGGLTPAGVVIRERDLFIAAWERDDPAERETYLAQVCGSDVGLRRRVERLLQLHEDAVNSLKPTAVAPGPSVDAQTGAFLGGSEDANAPSISGAEPPPLAEAAATRLGPYRLLEKLGEGGMGAVWVAEQQEPVKRRVALKVIKPGMDGPVSSTASRPNVRPWR